MMIKKSIAKLSIGKKIQGVSLWFNPDSTVSCTLIIIKKTRDEITIEKRESYQNLEELLRNIMKDLPLHLNIDGKGILYRHINIEEGDSELKDILPSANSIDFCFQSSKLNNCSRVASVGRQDHIDSILTKFNEQEIYPQAVNLGPLIYFAYYRLTDDSLLTLPQYEIIVNKDGTREIKRSDHNSEESELNIGDEKISNRYLFPFFTALNGFSEGAYLDFDSINLSDQVRNYRQKRLYRSLIITTPALIFFALLTNFILFERISGQNMFTAQQLGLYKDYSTTIDKLEKGVLSKKEFFERNLNLTGLNLSYISDRLAASVNRNIALTSMTLFPVKSIENRGSEEIDFANDVIRISGECRQSSSLAEWIKEIDNMEWVESVIISKYSGKHDQQKAQFELQISINN